MDIGIDALNLENIVAKAKPIIIMAGISYINLTMWYNYFKTKNLLENNSREEVEKKMYGGNISIIRRFHDYIGWLGYNSACEEHETKIKKEKEYSNTPKK